MAVIDVAQLKATKEARDEGRRQAAQWCQDAIAEFAAAARELETPPRGNPRFLDSTYGASVGRGVWPILLESKHDDYLLQLQFGASMTEDGKTWLGAKEASSEDLAWWIALRCNYSIATCAAVFEAALLGDAWTVRTALNHG